MVRNCLLALLGCGLAIAGPLHPVTVLPNESGVGIPANFQETATPAVQTGQDWIVGELDTVGGTTYDWVGNGPIYRFICNSPAHGIHVLWMFSADRSGTTFPDRNMRYNFYDYSTHSWNWIDPDYMASGVNVFTERSGYGNLDADPNTGIAWTVCHNGSPLRPVAARDLAPGAGIFEFCSSSPQAEAYQWPPVALDGSGKLQCALVDNATQDNLWYTRCAPWCTWQIPTSIVGNGAQPLFPTHNIAASKQNSKVCITWVNSEGYPYDEGYYRVSSDGGVTWDPTVQLDPPDAYGGDTVASFHITSLFPFYDRQDRLHIVACVNPIVRDTSYILPAEIWHWCPANSPQWSEIHRATCAPANLRAAVGYNALYACRPSIGEDRYGGLYVAWEQFDSANVEPSTNLLRADVFYSRDNYDNGATWVSATKLTDGGAGSRRFPSIVDRLSTDTLWITYEIDQIAGFFVMGQGAVTNNPIVVHKLYVPTGVAEHGSKLPREVELSVSPTTVAGHAVISFALPRAGEVSVGVYDVFGRPLATLADGQMGPGRYAISWHPKGLVSGVYVLKVATPAGQRTQKVTLVR